MLECRMFLDSADIVAERADIFLQLVRRRHLVVEVARGAGRGKLAFKAARSVVTGALEIKRAEKQIGASLESAPKVYVVDTALASVLREIQFSDICITSAIDVQEGSVPSTAFTLSGVEGVGVMFERAEGLKCARCWKYTKDVGKISSHPSVCARCAGVVAKSA